MVATLERRKPERLPVTTHHIMPYFLNQRLSGLSADGFFERFRLKGVTKGSVFGVDN